MRGSRKHTSNIKLVLADEGSHWGDDDFESLKKEWAAMTEEQRISELAAAKLSGAMPNHKYSYIYIYIKSCIHRLLFCACVW